MIVTDQILITVSKKEIGYFRKLGYEVNLNDTILIPIDHLKKGSHRIVDVKCDICQIEKKISYQKYIKNVENSGIYSCSSKCAQIKVKKTSISKWGEEYYTKTRDYKEKVEKSSMKKYGTTHHLKSDEIRQKIKKTNFEKFGSENPFSSKDIQKKISKTNIINWGFDNPSKNKTIKDKIRKKRIDHWKSIATNFYKDKLNIISIKDNGIYEVICEKEHVYEIHRSLLGNRIFLNVNLCTICQPKNSGTSSIEGEIIDYIKSIYKGEIILKDRKLISPKEIDILLPDIKVGFEVNGIWWHSEINKERDYHLKKWESSKENDIELFQIWEDDWKVKNDIIKSIIFNKISKSESKIFARKCEVKEISNRESKIFLKENHLYGHINSKINLGIYYLGELVSVMSFGGNRKPLGSSPEKGKYEILRYCNKKFTNVIGGASKLISFFIRNYEFSELLTYYDKSFGFKNVYEKIGFSYLGDTRPGYHYIINGIRVHRWNFRKSQLVKMGNDPNKTEIEIMDDLKIPRIWGVGNMKYILKNRKG